MPKNDESPQTNTGEFKENVGSQYHSCSRSKNKFKRGFHASPGEIKGSEYIETVKNLDNNGSEDASQELNRKRNRKELESQSEKLKDGLLKKKKKEDDDREEDDDNEEDADDDSDNGDNGAIKVPKARDLETVLIGVNSNHGLATAQGLKPKSDRF
jgi:hypothetical protein